MAIKHKTEKELIRDLQAENARLKAELMRAQANMDYLSMMTDACYKNLWKEGIEDV